jgi:putative ABC transport system permease protein
VLIRALLLVVRRSLQQHRVAGWITSCSIALACALLMTVSGLQHQANKVFVGQGGGWDAVLGARGSALQLVLAVLYHLENSPGNLPWSLYQELKNDGRVAAAVPVALGDNYRGYRIIGTTPEFFREWGSGGLKLARGRQFLPDRHEAVIGSWVAQRTGLAVGSTFHPYHGLRFDPAAEHADSYEVVGVLAPSNTPQDRAIWISLDGVYRMSGHVLRGASEEYTPEAGRSIPDAHKEVSGVLLRFKGPQFGMQFDQLINKQGKVATLAWPVGKVVFELFDKLGWMMQLLQLTTLLVLLVAAASITASLFNTLHERRREFAILRALGAGRLFVSAVLILESLWLSLVGTFLGMWVYYALMFAVTEWLRDQTGVQLDPWALHPGLALGPLLVLGVGALAGVLPSLAVYRGSVAPHLSSVS